ncbi:glycosyltransferase family 39 protein [Candidatus Woesearchaeota archaeon]|nr:glycosyltransferase family 39 protein [Candidatus Woesearchaeota archaeon]
MAAPSDQHGKASALKLRLSRAALFLILLLLLGFYLRSAGIFRAPMANFNDPNQPVWSHPDEYLQAEYASRIANYDFAWSDTSYIKPGVTVKFWFALFFLLLNILTPVTITVLLVLKASQLFSAAMGAATIIAVYFLGKEMYSRRTGLLAAAFFTVMMYHIKLSHYATPYAFFIFLWVMVVLLLHRFCFPTSLPSSPSPASPASGASHPDLAGQEAELHPYKLSSIVRRLRQEKTPLRTLVHWQLFLLGLFWMGAIASSYLSLFLVVPIALGLGMKWGMFADLFKRRKIVRQKLSFLLIAATNIGLGLFTGSILFFPHLYLDTKHVVQNFLWIFQEGSQGLYGLTATKGLGFWGMQLTSLSRIYWGIGLALFSLGLAALAFFLWRRKKQDVLIISILVLFCFYLGMKPLNLVRYYTVLYPFIAVMAAALLDAAIQTWPARHVKGIVYGIAAVVFCYSLLYSLMYVNILTEQDTRAVSGRWMAKNIPPGSSVLIGPGGTQPWMLPLVDMNRYQQSAMPDYIILVETVYLPIRWYLYDDIYRDSDWGTKLPSQDILAFYGQLFKGALPYDLTMQFSAKPHAFGFSLDDSGSPYELWALDSPDIQIYKVNEEKVNEIIEKEKALQEQHPAVSSGGAD